MDRFHGINLALHFREFHRAQRGPERSGSTFHSDTQTHIYPVKSSEGGIPKVVFNGARQTQTFISFADLAKEMMSSLREIYILIIVLILSENKLVNNSIL